MPRYYCLVDCPDGRIGKPGSALYRHIFPQVFTSDGPEGCDKPQVTFHGKEVGACKYPRHMCKGRTGGSLDKLSNPRSLRMCVFEMFKLGVARELTLDEFAILQMSDEAIEA